MTVLYMAGDFELACLKYHEVLREFHFWRWNAQNSNQQYSPVFPVNLSRMSTFQLGPNVNLCRISACAGSQLVRNVNLCRMSTCAGC